jgi:hypothetical protein
VISIPVSFKLGGRDWTVEYHELIDNDPSICGDTDGNDCVIRLKAGMKPATIQHTFYHELVHAWCFTLGWEKMNEDEGKVDALGGIILQYLRSKRGRL